jgi:hypothetical protein
MHGTWVTPHQNGRGNKTGQGNIEQQRIPMNGLNPAAESGLPGSELRTGTETLLELAGQNPEAAAQQAIQTLKDEVESFSGQELRKLVGVTTEATQKIDPQNEDVARIVGLIATPFNEVANGLFMETSAKIQEVLSGSTRSNEPPFSPFGSNTPSKQNSRGPVSAA